MFVPGCAYDLTGLHFYLNDALGTRRAQNSRLVGMLLPVGMKKSQNPSAPSGEEQFAVSC